MKEQFAFGEIKWAYSKDDRKIMIPFIINNTKDKVKDILSGKIYDNKSFFSLLTKENCFVTSGVQMVLVYGGKRMQNYRGFRHEEAYGKYRIVTKSELENIKNIFLLGISEAKNIPLKCLDDVKSIIDKSKDF